MADEPEQQPVGKELAGERQPPPEGHVLDVGLLGWAIGFGLATFGLAAALDALGVPWKITLAWTLLSWGILVTLEPGLISILLRPPAEMRAKKRPLKSSSPPPEKSVNEEAPESATPIPGIAGKGDSARADRLEPRFWIEEFPLLRRTSFRRMLELALMIALAELGFCRGPRPASDPAGRPSTVKLSDADEAALRKCLDHLCNSGSGDSNGSRGGGAVDKPPKPTGPGDRGNSRKGGDVSGNGDAANGAPSQITLRLDPELENALRQFLQEQQKPDSGSSTFPWGVAGIVVVV